MNVFLQSDIKIGVRVSAAFFRWTVKCSSIQIFSNLEYHVTLISLEGAVFSLCLCWNVAYTNACTWYNLVSLVCIATRCTISSTKLNFLLFWHLWPRLDCIPFWLKFNIFPFCWIYYCVNQYWWPSRTTSFFNKSFIPLWKL